MVEVTQVLPFWYVHIDDIPVASKDCDDKCRECIFGISEVIFLGSTTSGDGVQSLSERDYSSQIL